MSEMIERVGAAITNEYDRWKQRFVNREDGIWVTIYREDDDGNPVDIVGAQEFRRFELEGYKEFGRLRREAVGRKAIEATREPTEAMEDAALRHEASPRNYWQAMIDEALK